jgi:hypothetical protein
MRRVTSGSRERATISAGRPFSTARLCSPEAANEVSKMIDAPSGVAWKRGMISS